MSMTKLKIATTVLLILACVGMGLGGLAYRMNADEKAKPNSSGSVGGDAPCEKNGTVDGLKLTLSADKNETWMQPDGKNAVPVKLKLTFTNVSDKPIKLNAYDLRWRMGFRCSGPSPDSMHTILELVDRQALAPPTPPGFAGDPARQILVCRNGRNPSPETYHRRLPRS